jgi:hypothetical protein
MFVIKSIIYFDDREKDDFNQAYARFIFARAFTEAFSLVLVTKPLNRADLDNRLRGNNQRVKNDYFIRY